MIKLTPKVYLEERRGRALGFLPVVVDDNNNIVAEGKLCKSDREAEAAALALAEDIYRITLSLTLCPICGSATAAGYALAPEWCVDCYAEAITAPQEMSDW